MFSFRMNPSLFNVFLCFPEFCVFNSRDSIQRLQSNPKQGRIQDLIGGGPDRDRPKTAILGPQFCRILVLGPHFWWSGEARAPRAPPGSAPAKLFQLLL